MIARGLHITVEGIDGSGTTTQARQLVAWLVDRGTDAWLTWEPSEGGLGQVLRGALRGDDAYDPTTVALLYAADRVEHLRKEIVPRQTSGVHVISDRYVYSSLAYQSTTRPLSWIGEINRFAPEPDLTIYVRVDVETAAARRALRGGDPELFDALDLQRRIAQAYDEILGAEPAAPHWTQVAGRRGRVAVIDGGDTIDSIQTKLRHLIDEALARGPKGPPPKET